jgi:hypothetical protein
MLPLSNLRVKEMEPIISKEERSILSTTQSTMRYEIPAREYLLM